MGYNADRHKQLRGNTVEKPSPKDQKHVVRHSHGDIHVTVNNTQPAANFGVLERDWLTALLLSIFLGWIGIDSFYLGKTAKGILKFFTLGLFGILWIIDIIMIATRSVNNVVWTDKGGSTVKADKSTKPRPEKKQWSEMNRKEKTGVIIVLIVAAFIVIGIVSAIAGGGNKTANNNSPATDNSTSTSQTTQQAETKPAENKEPAVPAEYKSALAKAKQYSDTAHMSKQGIYDQLVSDYGEKFKPEAAQYAVDNLKADYNANALAKAKDYQKTANMSPAAIHDQLTSSYGEKFTAAEADYAIQHLND